jgi:hypothetical protein
MAAQTNLMKYSRFEGVFPWTRSVRSITSTFSSSGLTVTVDVGFDMLGSEWPERVMGGGKEVYCPAAFPNDPDSGHGHGFRAAGVRERTRTSGLRIPIPRPVYRERPN